MPTLAVLSRSDSFSEFWPKLAASAKADLAVANTVEEIAELQEELCGVIVAAAGAELSVLEEVGVIHGTALSSVCVVGAATEHRVAIAVLRAGANDYFALPGDIAALRTWSIESAERSFTSERVEAFAAVHRQRYDFSRIVGRSPCLTRTIDRACKIIPHGDATVLIHGETGTGKELLARAIHYNGPRAAEPFVEVNCAALPENLLESELFGYEPGAFTDAKVAKPGLIEVASGGTLFLDEIGDLPVGLQGKLLRVLEDKSVRRLGGLRNIDANVRIIAATHVDLVAAVRERRFREDLLYRLNIVPLRLPPLRERGDDVLRLARHFLERFGQQYDRPGLVLNAQVERALLDYSWPGNVRELRNLIERAVLLGDGPLKADDLFAGETTTAPLRGDAVLPFPASIHEIEVAAAHAAVARHGGNKTRAAAMLKISRKYLYELLSHGKDGHAHG